MFPVISRKLGYDIGESVSEPRSSLSCMVVEMLLKMLEKLSPSKINNKNYNALLAIMKRYRIFSGEYIHTSCLIKAFR